MIREFQYFLISNARVIHREFLLKQFQTLKKAQFGMHQHNNITPFFSLLILLRT